MVSLPLQEMGGDYGIQRFVGNFGAIVFAPLGGYVIDQASTDTEVDFSPAIYIYLVLKLVAGVFIHSILLIAFFTSYDMRTIKCNNFLAFLPAAQRLSLTLLCVTLSYDGSRLSHTLV